MTQDWVGVSGSNKSDRSKNVYNKFQNELETCEV